MKDSDLEPKKDYNDVQREYLDSYVSRTENVFGINSHLKSTILNQFK
jgi:hypothetical protein